MKKILNYLLIFIKILLEQATLVATIIASTYIVITSQIKAYSTNTLLLWLISLLGLVATSSVSEQYFKLNKMNKDIESIKESIGNRVIEIDGVFLTRKDQSPLEERLENANAIFLSGGSLARLSDEYYACFEDKLRNRCSIEIVLVKPFSPGADLLCQNVVYETIDKVAYSQKIEDSLVRFARLKREFPQLVTIRITENIPPFGIIATNLERQDAKIQVELYSYAVPTRERMQFNISKSDKKTFQFFVSQINTLKEQSDLYRE